MNPFLRFAPFVLAALLAAGPALAQQSCPAGYPATTPDGDFADAGNGTVRHLPTGLIWKRCAEGQTWDGSTCQGTADAYTWEQAFQRAAAVNAGSQGWNAGQSDWRLPNQKELRSIVERGCVNPSINLTQFPATPTSVFWSGSPFAGISGYAWSVLFNGGFVSAFSRYGAFQVRLVRAGQYFYHFDAAADTTAPVLSTIGVSGTTQTATTLSATSDEAATGYWIVVARNATAPTAAQVKAGANYGAVTVVASGSGAMTAAVARTFAVSGLTAGTDYDLYLAAEDTSVNANLSASPGLVQFSTSPATYAITVNAGTGGTASCSPNPVTHGSSSTCTATPNAGYSFSSWSGDCTGGTCTLSNVTSAKTVTASFVADGTKSYSGPSATGSGSVTASFTGGGAGCGFSVSQFIAVATVPEAPPAGVAFPHGLFDFTTSGCGAGATLEFTITYPTALPAGTQYWKYGPTPDNADPHWYGLPATVSGNQVTFSITDGGLGDDDWALGPNGTVVDQGGPGFGGSPTAIPTLSEWGMVLLSLLLAGLGWQVRPARRR